jgi:DNA polymerase-4
VDERFGLGASIGVGPNKLIAKMAAGVHKPRGLTALDQESFRRTFWPLDVQELWGVGPKLAVRMRSLGITTVGDLAHAPSGVLKDAFGIVGPALRDAASGHDETPLVPYWRGVDPKSMGHEVTLPRDSRDREFLEGILLRLSDQVGRRLRSEGFVGRTVTIKLRNSSFQTLTRQRALAEPTADEQRVFEVARALFHREWRGDALRLLGVSVASLEREADSPQTEMFEGDRRARRLREAMDRVRDRMGEAVLVPAGSLNHRREMGHVPFGALGAAMAAQSAERRRFRSAPGRVPSPGADSRRHGG